MECSFNNLPLKRETYDLHFEHLIITSQINNLNKEFAIFFIILTLMSGLIIFYVI